MHLLDLFCGRGGWSKPWISAGLSTLGIDLHNRGYPSTMIRRRLPTDIAPYLDADTRLVVASPPCDAFARHHLPWIHAELSQEAVDLLNWSISLIGSTEIPVIVECSRFAIDHATKPPTMKAGPYALWGDVPALLPQVTKNKGIISGQDPARRAEISQDLAAAIMQAYAPSHLIGTKRGSAAYPRPLYSS